MPWSRCGALTGNGQGRDSELANVMSRPPNSLRRYPGGAEAEVLYEVLYLQYLCTVQHVWIRACDGQPQPGGPVRSACQAALWEDLGSLWGGS
jgi:hypothetical protein